MKLAIGCDHIAFNLKELVKQHLTTLGHEVVDCGTYNQERTHYPIFGNKVASLVAKKEVDRGIVICGTGIGIGNAANKTKKIRCALVNQPFAAVNAVEKYNANVIAMGTMVVGRGLAIKITEAYLGATYKPTATATAIIADIDNLIKTDNYDIDFKY